MGADLLVAWVWTTDPEAIDFEKARALAREELGSVEMPDEVWPPGVLERWDPNEDLVYEGSDFGADDLLNRVIEDIDEIEKLWGGEEYRDTIRAGMGPVEFLMSGGMSWGDSPTETFDVLNRFANTPAAKAAGFFDGEGT